MWCGGVACRNFTFNGVEGCMVWISGGVACRVPTLNTIEFNGVEGWHVPGVEGWCGGVACRFIGVEGVVYRVPQEKGRRVVIEGRQSLGFRGFYVIVSTPECRSLLLLFITACYHYHHILQLNGW